MKSLINQYSIIEKLYSGSNSVVYKAIHNEHKSSAILKVLQPSSPSQDELSRFQYEYELTNNNIDGTVDVIGIEDYEQTKVIIEKDINAESLNVIMKKRSLTLDETLLLAIKISKIIGNIHKAKIIHKDINPSNIVWNSKTNRLKLIDFGIASHLPSESFTLKSLNQLEGTLAYISPEQTGRINRVVDYRTDLYSLGVTLYEMLTGQLPFIVSDAMELVHCHVAKKPKSLSEINPDIPQIVSDIIMKLLEKNAEDRYSSAFGLKNDLEICEKQLLETQNISTLKFELGNNDFSGELDIAQKLYGRSEEINTLLDAFEESCCGASKLLLVAGFSGIGKTALIQEVRKPMTEKKGYYITGKFSQFQKNIPYFAITQAFNSLCKHMMFEELTVLNSWKSSIEKALGNNAQIIVDLIPDLQLIIGEQPKVVQLGAIETENRFLGCFKKFIKVICTSEHPLILFIDDLQWADVASLNLLKSIVSDEKIKHLLIIGAYRDNEVGSGHRLTMTIDELKKDEITVDTIKLENLTKEDIANLLSESLKCDLKQSQPLADLTHLKTLGNAFFTHQFIHMLYKNELLNFDFTNNLWVWDIKKIKSENITDNVVELMTSKMVQLPKQTLEIINLSACIGSHFSLQELTVISGYDSAKIVTLLAPSLMEGLIKPLSDDYKYVSESKKIEFGFVHDRIQQAAYEMTTGDAKREVHLKIARLLLENSDENKLQKNLFYIVAQFSHCLDLITDEKEKKEVCSYYVLAGKKAKQSTAYQTSLSFLLNAQKLLSTDCWHDKYELTLDIFTMLVELSYLIGDYKKMDEYYEVVSKNSNSIEDESRICNIKIQSLIFQNRLNDGIKEGLIYFNQMGIEFPDEVTFDDVGKELGNLASLLKDADIESLYKLDEMSNEKIKIAMSINVAIIPAAYQANPTLMILLILKQVELAIKYGNVSESSYSYICYGFILCGVVGDIETGYKFGQLGLNLVKKYGNTGIIARSIMIYNYLVMIWKEPVRDTTTAFLENYHTGLEVGDLEFASYSVYGYFYHSLIAGKSLTALNSEIDDYILIVSKLKHEGVKNWMNIFKNLFTMLSSDSNFEELQESEKDEESRINRYKEENDRTAICHSYLFKSIENYMWNEYENGLKYVNLTAQYIDCLTSSVAVVILNFYDSLIRLALYKDSSDESKKELLEKVFANQEQLKVWADHAPMNYKHKYDLVEAEIASCKGELKAIDLYESAIAGANSNKYVQEEALAYELAAKFYFERKMEKFATTYIRESYSLYKKWGANAKAKQLKNKYIGVVQDISNLIDIDSTTRSDRELDVESIIKASQTISKEMNFGQLLKNLISIVIENVGAEKGVLIINEEENYKVQALKTTSPDKIEIMQNINIDECSEIPSKIVSSVIKSKEAIVINDASSDEVFSNIQYVKRNKTKSILCMPMILHSKIVGIIYLENNQLSGVFNKNRVGILNILSSQAVIAIGNAITFEKLNIEKKYSQNIITNSPSMIIGLDTTGNTTFVNPRVEQVTGYNSDEIINKNWWDIFYPKEEYKQVDSFFKQLTRGEVVDYEMSLTRKDGEKRVVVWNSSSQKDSKNQVSEIIGFGSDITEKKVAESSLHKLQNYLSNIIDSMPSVLIGVNKTIKVTQWNKMAEETYGITAKDALGEYITSLIPSLQLESCEIADSIKSKKIKKSTDTVTERSNETVFEDITVYPLVTNGDEGAVIRIDNVTKKHILQEQLSQSSKMDAIGQLAGGVAHDFNNMLSGIVGAAQLLQLPLIENKDEEGLEFVGMILSAADRAADLTAKLLAFGRKNEESSASIDIHQTISDTIAILNRTIDRNISITYSKSAINSILVGNTTSLQNSILNLGINASHAMPNGGELSFSTKNINLDKKYCEASPFAVKPGEYVELEVRDTGAGISPENIKKIFEPFFTTKKQGEGTGLGLASVFGTIQKHSGAINVYSELGVGTAFHLYFPCSDQSISFVNPNEVVLKGSGKILLVDDEELIRVTGKYMLEQMGYTVILAEDGLDAVEIFKMNKDEIDLVLMDMIMPKMNGSKAFYKMREIDSGCKVIISSGFTKDESLDELKKAGLSGFIQKPFRDYELSKLLVKTI